MHAKISKEDKEKKKSTALNIRDDPVITSPMVIPARVKKKKKISERDTPKENPATTKP